LREGKWDKRVAEKDVRGDDVHDTRESGVFVDGKDGVAHRKAAALELSGQARVLALEDGGSKLRDVVAAV
jgi:hypothetical protein